eukprot:1299073-Heterocapsa_arctica.AAC.1
MSGGLSPPKLGALASPSPLSSIPTFPSRLPDSGGTICPSFGSELPMGGFGARLSTGFSGNLFHGWLARAGKS